MRTYMMAPPATTEPLDEEDVHATSYSSYLEVFLAITGTTSLLLVPNRRSLWTIVWFLATGIIMWICRYFFCGATSVL